MYNSQSLASWQEPTVGRTAWLCRNVIPVLNISKKIQVAAFRYPELCQGPILSLLCLFPCWERKVFFYLPDFSGAFSLQGFLENSWAGSENNYLNRAKQSINFDSPKEAFSDVQQFPMQETPSALQFCVVLQHITLKTEVEHKKRKQSLQGIFTFVGILFWMFMATQVAETRLLYF